MSLVICSNQEKDGTTERQRQSVYNAWAFRNPLSSTMTIPANAQVALQSCKVNVDGRAVFSRNNHKFYHYFGDKLNLDGSTPPQIEDSTSYPLITTLTNDSETGQAVEMGVEDLANRIQEQIRSTTYHPNAKEAFKCSVLRNDDNLDFVGFKYEFIQNASNANVNNRPANSGFEDFYREDQDEGIFSYINNIFQRETDDRYDKCCAIAKAQPFSLTNGSFIVEINNGSFANVNSSGVEWHVGLSRAVNQLDNDGYYMPNYAVQTEDDDLPFDEECFMDFAVARDNEDKLRCYHYIHDSSLFGGDRIMKKEVKYYNNTNSSFTAGEPFDLNASDNAGDYSKVGFFSEGENMKVMLYNGSSSNWELITEFDSGESYETFFKPINQSCICLHPVLCIGEDGNASKCTMRIEEFSGLDLADYDATKINKGGWFETLEILGRTFRCKELEKRDWNDYGVNDRQYKLLNASGGVNYSFVMITEESNIYKPTFGANAKTILGFNRGIIDIPNSGAGTNNIIFQSDFKPKLTSSKAIFVKLNNFGQDVVNAHQGNKSKILCHLPRFDNTNETGRLYFEPNEMVFIDLNNAQELKVNEFDISFSYINEQYATILQGQSIVCLYFRKKPKELM